MKVRFDQVAVRLSGRPVLQNITLELSQRRVGVIGLNGSGKSTLARLINGLAMPTTGRVLVDDLDTAKEAAAIRRRVGFVFSDPDAQIVMPTAGEDVSFSLRRKGLSKAQVRDQAVAALARFGLEDRYDAPAHLLSGGEKQLLALAAVLVTGPDLVICDEPTTLLDLRNTRRIAQEIAGLEQSVILLTHHLEQLHDFDRVVVLHQGRLYADDTPAAAIAAYRALAEQ